jgi:glutamyl-tRNA synthetase
MTDIRVRFAPSPTGYIHVGNARTALFNWLFARQNKGVFVLRVEDTDVERSLEEYEHRLIDDLRWMGLDWDEGPNLGGNFGPYRQSQRLNIYQDSTQKLLAEGKAYYCFCSTEQLEKEREAMLARGTMPIYSGRCRTLDPGEAEKRVRSGEKAAVRLKVPDEGLISFDDLIRRHLEFDLKLIGDPVLVRSTGLPAYNYAVVIDDHLMKITHVIRGEDHISNTPRQILTYRALGLEPPLFVHLAMVMGKDNTRLSKRHGATAVDQFAKEGYLAPAFFNYLALLGWAPPEGREVLEKPELLELFDLRKASRSAAIFDYEKLHWINRQHIKKMGPGEKARRAFPFLTEAGLLPEAMTDGHWRWLEKAVESLMEGVDKFSELPQKFSLLFDFAPLALDEEAESILKSESAPKVITAFAQKLERAGVLDYAKYAAIIEEIKKETGIKGKALFHPLRVALTARTSGLELDKFIPLVEEGARFSFPRPIKSCLERVGETKRYLETKAVNN